MLLLPPLLLLLLLLLLLRPPSATHPASLRYAFSIFSSPLLRLTKKSEPGWFYEFEPKNREAADIVALAKAFMDGKKDLPKMKQLCNMDDTGNCYVAKPCQAPSWDILIEPNAERPSDYTMVSNDAMYAAVVADKPHTLTMLYDPEDCNSRQLFRVIAELTRTDDGMNAMNVALVDATSAKNAATVAKLGSPGLPAFVVDSKDGKPLEDVSCLADTIKEECEGYQPYYIVLSTMARTIWSMQRFQTLVQTYDEPNRAELVEAFNIESTEEFLPDDHVVELRESWADHLGKWQKAMTARKGM
jgi:hypothetical protein